MIEFYAENGFKLEQKEAIAIWISDTIVNHGYEVGDIAYVFCNDAYLYQLNVEFLQHDTLTDIISFDNSLGKETHGEIYVSTERVADNATTYQTSFQDELHRVLIHGALHLCGLKDKSPKDAEIMRAAENKALSARIFL